MKEQWIGQQFASSVAVITAICPIAVIVHKHYGISYKLAVTYGVIFGTAALGGITPWNCAQELGASLSDDPTKSAFISSFAPGLAESPAQAVIINVLSKFMDSTYSFNSAGFAAGFFNPLSGDIWQFTYATLSYFGVQTTGLGKIMGSGAVSLSVMAMRTPDLKKTPNEKETGDSDEPLLIYRK